MEKLVLIVAGGAAILFFTSIAGALFGGLSGWVVGFFWTDPILDFLRRFGVDVAGLTTWQIGVALGFMGGFFRTTLSQKAAK